MRKTLSVLAIIAALSSSAYAVSTAASFTGGENVIVGGPLNYVGNGNVTIANGSEDSSYSVRGKHSTDASVSGATVTMTGGTIEGDVTGASTFSAGCEASNNTVTISGGEVGDSVFGGWSVSGTANNNTVTISGGKVGGDVKGGYSMQGYSCSNNTVNLVGAGATLGTLTGSSFTIGGKVTVGSITGSTLNVYGKGITIGKGFGECVNTVNFHLTPGTKNGDTMLTLTEGGLSANYVNVKCSGDTLLDNGDKVTLVHVVGDGFVTVWVDTDVDIIKGVSATYEGHVAVNEKDLVLTVGDDAPVPGPEPTPVPGPGVKVEFNTLKSMTETRTDVAALVNTVADFLATTGMQQARMTAKAAAATGNEGVAPFVALGGSHLRYNTGSHVNANGFNTAVGVAKSVSSVTLGVAGEYGTSDYKSYVGGVRAKGDSKLWGGAILADWQGKHGWHAEGSVSLGRADYDYSAATPLGYTHYSDKASYQSTYVGGGKEFKLSEACNDTVDLYARYMYGHTNGSNATATSGESIHFSGVNSHRSLLGARYNHQLCDQAAVYAGAAWMHEYAGDAKGVIGGFKAPSPSLGGSSGMLELGTSYAPGQDVLLNLNIQGWTGVQRGISGGVGVQVRF